MKNIIIVALLTVIMFNSFGQTKASSKCRRLCKDKTQSDIQKSITFYKNRILQIPADQDSYYSLGMCFTKLQKLNVAINYYDSLITINSNYYAALSNRGLCKSFLGDQEGACNDFAKSVEIGQDFKVIDNIKLSEYIKIKCNKN